MIVDLLDDLLAFLLIPAFILHILHYGLYRKYVFTVIRPLLYVFQVAYAVILLTPKIAVGLLKAVLVAVLTVVLVLVYMTSFVVPYIGGRVGNWRESLKGGVVAFYISVQLRKMRAIMVRIVAEEDDRNLDFEDHERYRTELNRVKQDAKNRLETGETLLSILLGAVLLASKLTGVKLLQASISGLRVDLLVEVWLLTIAVSIIYRTSVLEFLAYGSDDEFNSLDEMDAALEYQKGVSLVGFIQGLMFLLVFMAAISKVRYNLIEDALRAKYTDEPWIAFTWERLTN